MLKRLVTVFTLIASIVGSSLLFAEMKLSGDGKFVAEHDVLEKDAYLYARNRALVNASEKAVLLIESDKTMVNSSLGSWTRTEMRELSASLIRVIDEEKSKAVDEQNRVVYQVHVTALFDDAQQHVLQQTFDQNGELKALLHQLSNTQNQLLDDQRQTEKMQEDAAAQTKRLASRPAITSVLAHYDQTLNDTRAWIGQQQKTHLQMAVQTIAMQQELEAVRKKQREEQAKIQAKREAELAAANEQDAKVLANLQYIAARRIVRFVKSHLPLVTSNVSAKAAEKDQVDISYDVNWKMSYADIEQLCGLFADSKLSMSCSPAADNKSVQVQFKPVLAGGFFDPIKTHANVWENPKLFTGFKEELINVFTVLKNNQLRISIAGGVHVTAKQDTKSMQARLYEDVLGVTAKWN